ncbi:hypothetical protein ACFWYW_51120 [Nonomuraea sp. NPDC059023]|uniref:hypothetical protein n=1 Tax=unclassified Nonomuraea TaxID=2593643 RepID=UPI0036B2AAA9
MLNLLMGIGFACMLIGLLYVGLYMAIWLALSAFLPPAVAPFVTVALLVLGTALTLWRWKGGSVLLGRYLVARTSAWGYRRVVPIRLAGVGTPRDRFDLSLIDREPDGVIGGLRLHALGLIRGRDAYLVTTPHDLQVWVHHKLLSFHRALVLDLHEVRKLVFIHHDPDRLGRRDDHALRYVGTLEIVFSDHRHLFLYVRVKPKYGS